jgi:Cu-Zn family superoxide dismutase
MNSVTSADINAKCVLIANGNSGISGDVKFEQNVSGGKVEVKGEINGLNGIHGFHIHEKPLVGIDCATSGGHYNPFGVDHGDRPAIQPDRHNGDQGNIKKSGDTTKFSWDDEILSLTGQYSIVGRTCVIHANADDLGLGGDASSKANGNAGPRVACGMVALTNTSFLKVSLTTIFMFIGFLLF